MTETTVKLHEIEDAFSQPGKWLNRELRRQTRGATATAAEAATKIALYAYVQTPTQPPSVLHVADWKPSDLYAYSDAPRVELLNTFDDLLRRTEAISQPADDLDFELKTVELWENVRRLNAYLGISPQHDELITTLGTLIASRKSVLDSDKLACLKRTFTKLRDTINITDDLLDQIADDLEHAGFDIQAPMTFADV
jgi:hypothetical protein